MKIYLNAITETLLIMLIVGVMAAVVMWLFLTTFHAPKNIIFDGEIFAVIATAIGAVFFFRKTLQMEKHLAAEEANATDESEAA